VVLVTEVEKLRALLAEARIRISPCVQAPCSHDDCCLRSRIDAALAEPVQPPKPPRTTWARFAYDFRERAEKAERERDEARAEVEDLKAQVWALQIALKAASSGALEDRP